MNTAPDPACWGLLHSLGQARSATEGEWERMLRLARRTGLHARLAATHLAGDIVPAVVRRHLISSERVATYRAQMVRAELFRLAPLCQGDFPVIVLKGGAYLLENRRMAVGRFVSDVDLLVPAASLRTMEARLREAGWRAEELDPYDERYYRDWSHETPPMRYPGRSLEVDLHHAITPVTGSLAFDPQPLFEASRPVPGTPFRVLAPEDQVLHACLHCFHDGDMELRVREVVDIDGLLRDFTHDSTFLERLAARAAYLGLGRPLWYGLHYARLWLDSPVPESIAGHHAPTGSARRVMDTLVPLTMLPADPDFPEPSKVRWARVALLARYHWLRMPLRLLLPHLARKAWRQGMARLVRGKAAAADGAP